MTDKKEYSELAWPKGDLPENGNFYPVAQSDLKKVISLIEEILNEPVNDLKSIVPFTSGSITGRFFVETDKKQYFARITKRIGFPDLERSLVSFLYEANCPVNALLNTKLIDYGSDLLRIDLYPYLDSRVFDWSLNDFYSLGRGMHLIHKNLSMFSNRKEIMSNSIERYKALNIIKENISDYTLQFYLRWSSENLDLLKEFQNRFNPFFNELKNPAILHGEVHPGNVLFSKTDSRIIFIDFEESVHTFAPVSWDLAFIAQRFILKDFPPHKTALERKEMFEKGYGKKIENVFCMMEQIIFFSIAVIFNLASKNIYTSESELIKFSKMYSKIQEYKGVFS